MNPYFLLIAGLIGLNGCVSNGPYFNIKDLQEMVKLRSLRADVLADFGPARTFSDKVFKGGHMKPTDKLLIQEVDGEVFSDVERDQESDFNNMEFAPSELSSAQNLKKRNSKQSLSQRGLVSHNTEATEVNDCRSRSRNIRYSSNRMDPNGYTERQFTILYFNQNQEVCGFKTMSMFLPN